MQGHPGLNTNTVSKKKKKCVHLCACVSVCMRARERVRACARKCELGARLCTHVSVCVCACMYARVCKRVCTQTLSPPPAFICMQYLRVTQRPAITGITLFLGELILQSIALKGKVVNVCYELHQLTEREGRFVSSPDTSMHSISYLVSDVSWVSSLLKGSNSAHLTTV